MKDMSEPCMIFRVTVTTPGLSGPPYTTELYVRAPTNDDAKMAATTHWHARFASPIFAMEVSPMVTDPPLWARIINSKGCGQ